MDTFHFTFFTVLKFLKVYRYTIWIFGNCTKTAQHLHKVVLWQANTSKLPHKTCVHHGISVYMILTESSVFYDCNLQTHLKHNFPGATSGFLPLEPAFTFTSDRLFLSVYFYLYFNNHILNSPKSIQFFPLISSLLSLPLVWVRIWLLTERRSWLPVLPSTAVCWVSSVSVHPLRLPNPVLSASLPPPQPHHQPIKNTTKTGIKHGLIEKLDKLLYNRFSFILDYEVDEWIDVFSNKVNNDDDGLVFHLSIISKAQGDSLSLKPIDPNIIIKQLYFYVVRISKHRNR